MSRDVIGVVERAYDLVGTERDWLEGLATAARPLLDRGQGTIAYCYRAPAGAPLAIEHLAAAGTRGEVVDAIVDLVRRTPPEMIERTFRAHTGCATTSEMTGLGLRLAEHPLWRDILMPIGMADYFATNVLVDSAGRGCIVGAVLDRVARTMPRERRIWDRLAAHISAGLRLRDALDGGDPLTGAEAVFSPSGRLEHAEPATQPARTREQLRGAVAALERARGRLRSRDPDEALDLWKGLVDGRWSLVDHFDRGGRRYVLARKNDPGVTDPRALGLRERQVAWYVSLGHSNKLIAYELGLSLSSVSTHLRRASTKLGVGSRSALIELVRALVS